jgi:hypothetical protein
MTNFNSIVQFKENFNGGTRSNRFIVRPNWPTGVSTTTNDSTFKIVSASLPAVQINSITVPYRGRLINFAGDRQYTPWTIGVYDDGNVNNLWRAFQRWKELMDGHYTHKVANDDFRYATLQKTWTMEQLSLNGNKVLRRIILYKCWPSVVGEISLNMGESNFVAFNVSLTFDYMKIDVGLNDVGN